MKPNSLDLQVSFPGEPDPTCLGRFLQRMLFLLTNSEAAAAILGIEHPPAVIRAVRTSKGTAGKAASLRTARKSCASQAESSQALQPVASLPPEWGQGLRRTSKGSLPACLNREALEVSLCLLSWILHACMEEATHLR